MKLDLSGHRSYCYTGGRPLAPERPTVVFIHGAGHDHSVWSLQTRYFVSHGWNVLAPDLPGHGSSDGPALASIEALADWVLALVAGVGCRRVMLAGHSMGSLIALEAAARAPERITQLGLIGTAFPMKVSPALLATARETPQAAIDLVNTFSLSTIAAKPSFPAPGAWLHGGQRALMRRMQGQAEAGGLNLFAHDFAICDAYAGGLQAAAAVRCPAALVLGRRDSMTPPRAARELGEALRATVTTLPAGHSLMAEAPDGVLAALRALLD